jgi:hypothetical protein
VIIAVFGRIRQVFRHKKKAYKISKKRLVMNLNEKKKLPWLKIVIVLCVIAVLWQFMAIRKELQSLKTEVSRDLKSLKSEVAYAKSYALAAGASNDSDVRTDDLDSKVDDLESKVIGGYGLESRVYSLESKVSDMLSHSH